MTEMIANIFYLKARRKMNTFCQKLCIENSVKYAMFVKTNIEHEWVKTSLMLMLLKYDGC